MPKSLIARTAALISLAIALGIAVAAGVRLWQEREPAILIQDKGATGAASIGGPFTLTDQHGVPVSDDQFRGRFMLVYFGYSFCQDICPTDLATMTTALDQLGDAGGQVQPIFVTIDPEHDTVERLAEYAPLFHPRLIALTGTPEEISRVAAQYRVYYEKSGSGPDYLMDHSGIIYLMDREGRFLTHFSQGTTPDRIADAIRQAQAQHPPQSS